MFPSHMSVNDLGVFAVVMVFGWLIVLLFIFDFVKGFIKRPIDSRRGTVRPRIAKETADKFAKGGLQEHISLWKCMIAMAIKAISVTGMGRSFRDKKEVDELAAMYDVIELEFGMLFFAEGRKPEDLEKNPGNKDKNQQQTQPTCETRSGNLTQATVCWDEMEEHLTSPSPGPDSDREINFQKLNQRCRNLLEKEMSEF
ncbi:hypothetical protein AWC38_SpisGene20337 [Stylophora pistillata]|uniref:Uncharacterized protein n=1 Tax=Stylophora pistillata TaxID=50429 RepID=A0A2B4RGH4_STYPI|nr:hypothetical protein AWC38_SpisGene20337 [Stylophora pistillata]